MLQHSSPCTPLHTAALPSHHPQDSPPLPAPRDRDRSPAVGRAWWAGAGAGNGDGNGLCALLTALTQPRGSGDGGAQGAPTRRRFILVFIVATAIAPNGNAKGCDKAQGVKICPHRALWAIKSFHWDSVWPSASWVVLPSPFWLRIFAWIFFSL